MDIGSDADLVFVVDETRAPGDREPWRRTTERLLEIVSSHTRDGLLFPADTRLRPRGNEGELLQSTAYLRQYYREEAQGWEAAAVLKARAVAGNVALGERVLEDIRGLLAERYSGEEGAARLAQELDHTRQRMEREGNSRRDRAGLAPFGGFSPGAEPVDFKSVRGGYYDIDYVVAYSALTQAAGQAEAPPLQKPIALMEAGKLPELERRAWETLRATAVLYRCLDHASRLVTGHPVLSYQRTWKEILPGGWLWDLPRRHDLFEMLQAWGVDLPAGLEASLDTARERIRELYDATVTARAAV
jgi:glutamine synthetase adenylyltransferase